MYTLSEIWIYPIKSLGGIRLTEARVQERGLQYDRRWMLVDPAGKFLTQRTVHEMSQLDVAFGEGGFVITHRAFPGQQLLLPFSTPSRETMSVQIWNDTVEAVHVSPALDARLSQWLHREVRLVAMPDWTARPIDPDYAREGETVSFADGYPLLVVSQASLDDLNSRLKSPISMQRFRPNLIVEGSEAYAEDNWKEIQIGSATFRGVKPCARCVLTTIDPATGSTGAEPLKTLATYRKHNNKILFGMNLLARPGHVAVGDLVVTA
jgi:uncharacterized protein